MPCQPSPPKAHPQALVRWKLLRDHDTAEVIATIDDAFVRTRILKTSNHWRAAGWTVLK
jgi:hypothetical protein